MAIGTDPATTFAAIVPAPPDVEEYLIAGFLRGKPVELVQCETVDLQVPAHAEYVLEGYVNLGELRTEGPFGDHTGFYSPAGTFPVFRVTAITRRRALPASRCGNFTRRIAACTSSSRLLMPASSEM